MDTDPRAAALAFLKSRKTGVLATLSPAGDTPHARLVYYACDDALAVYFLTLASTRKAEDLKTHHRAAFVVADESVPQTVQMEGSVKDLTDEATLDSPVTDLFKNLSSNAKYYAPIARFDQADVRYYKLTPEWVRWGDFTQGRHTDEVVKEIIP